MLRCRISLATIVVAATASFNLLKFSGPKHHNLYTGIRYSIQPKRQSLLASLSTPFAAFSAMPSVTTPLPYPCIEPFQTGRLQVIFYINEM